MEESRESKLTKYYTRAVWRMIKLAISIFILFVVVIGIVYVGAMIWSFVFGG